MCRVVVKGRHLKQLNGDTTQFLSVLSVQGMQLLFPNHQKYWEGSNESHTSIPLAMCGIVARS